MSSDEINVKRSVGRMVSHRTINKGCQTIVEREMKEEIGEKLFSLATTVIDEYGKGAATVNGIVNGGFDIYDYAKGNIDGKQFGKRCIYNTAESASTGGVIYGCAMMLGPGTWTAYGASIGIGFIMNKFFYPS